MQIALITEAGTGEVILLPPEIALDDYDLSVDIPGSEIPGRAGRRKWRWARRVQPRTLRASGTIKGLDRAEADALAKQYRGYLLGRGELWLKRDQNSTELIRVDCTNLTHNYHRGRFLGSMFTMSLTFQADDPFWYAAGFVSYEKPIDEVTTPWTVTQPGTLERQCPVVRIFCAEDAEGPIVNPVLENETTGTKIEFAGEIEPGQALVIRHDPLQAYLGEITLEQILTFYGYLSTFNFPKDDDGDIEDKQDVIGGMNVGWLLNGFNLKPGENQLVYSEDGSSSGEGFVQVAWRPAYY